MVAGEGDFGLQDHKSPEEARERARIPPSGEEGRAHESSAFPVQNHPDGVSDGIRHFLQPMQMR